jgi:ABC-2 type transport system permease protein
MKKFWLVSWNEYRSHVLRWRFLVVLASPLLMIAAVFGFALLMIWIQTDRRPIGYVDQSGMFATARVPLDVIMHKPLPVLGFPDETAARQAVQARRIQGYYIILPSYPEDASVELVAAKRLSNGIADDFSQFIRANLVSTQPPGTAKRLIAGTVIINRLQDKSREVADNNVFSFMLPIMVGFLLIFVINTSGGYLMQAVVDEKENRTMEILVTSVSPEQLMVGKIVGNLSVGLTQLLVWIGIPMLLLLPMREQVVSLFSRFGISPQFFWLTGASMLPAFVLIAALMAAVGATATESREASQVATIFTLPVTAPYFLFTLILASPNSALARGLSYFPLTAPLTLTMRASATTLPAWDIAISLTILYGSAVLALWMAGRVFRLGMLRYGRSLSLRDILPFGKTKKAQP